MILMGHKDVLFPGTGKKAWRCGTIRGAGPTIVRSQMSLFSNSKTVKPFVKGKGKGGE